MKRFDVVIVHYGGSGPGIEPREDERRIVIDNTINNLGWVRGANAGLAATIAPYVVLMNDDCRVITTDWLPKMAESFQHERVGVVGPWGGRGYQGRLLQDTGTHLCEPKLSLEEFGIGRFPLSFFCVMFSRAALNDVGLLDERFSPAYAEDDDWLARAHLRGWKMAIQTDVQVEHIGGGYGGQRSALQARNEKLLKEKWAALLTIASPRFLSA